MFGRVLFAVAFCVALVGCSSPPPRELSVPDKVATSGEVEARLARMEQDILSLRMENERRVEALRNDVEALRAQIQELAETLEGRVQQDELDSSAKEFARESMQRMLDLSKKIMDRLEKELDGPADGGPEQQDDSSSETDKTI